MSPPTGIPGNARFNEQPQNPGITHDPTDETVLWAQEKKQCKSMLYSCSSGPTGVTQAPRTSCKDFVVAASSSKSMLPSSWNFEIAEGMTSQTTSLTGTGENRCFLAAHLKTTYIHIYLNTDIFPSAQISPHWKLGYLHA
jgi:hypothetical protein